MHSNESKKEDMDLKKSKEVLWEGLERGKGKKKWYNYNFNINDQNGNKENKWVNENK